MTDHRWAVDSIEEGVARVEEDGERMLNLPAHLLPAGALAGHVLRVTRTSAAKGSATVTISIDDSAAAEALAQSRKQTSTAMKESGKRDKGGDVAL